MFEEKLVDTNYRIWPYTFELYLILSYKVTSRYSEVFNNLSKQVYNTIQVLNLYDDPECKVVGEVKMDIPGLDDVTKPLREIFTLLSDDGAFVAELKYRPSPQTMFTVLKLMSQSSVSLMWKVGHLKITNQEKVNEIYAERSKEIKSIGTAKNSLNTIRSQFKHDVTKYYLENQVELLNPNNASEEPSFQKRCRKMAEDLCFSDWGRFDRYLRDCLYAKLKLIDENEFSVNEHYFSEVD